MQICQFQKQHYEQLRGYWQQYGWVSPDMDLLPKNGFVAIKDDKVVAAAFVYQSCSGMALLDWVIADKNAQPLTRGKAVYSVINACRDFAKDKGFKVLYTVTANEHLQDTYRKIGFKDMEKNATSMAMSLDGSSLGFLRE